MSPIEDTIEGVAPDETRLEVVHKHFVGLLLVYLQIFVGLLAGGALIYFLTPVVFTNTADNQQRTYASVFMGIVAILAWLILAVYTYIYRQSKLIITDQNLTQVIQRGLFSRKVSELSMANVEDVTANQHGILASIFGYGDLHVETAGEQNNFDFKFCPNPNHYGRIVLDARQKYLDTHPNRR